MFGRERDGQHVTFFSDWDSNQPEALWDNGLQWDVNTGPSTGSTAEWLALVTGEHATKPNFMAMLAATFQPLADTIAVMESMPSAYDVDLALGSQLDATGQWIGASRYVTKPLTGVFFSWSTPGLGWGDGSWAPGLNVNELVQLPDAQYRTLLYARIAANHWDGSLPAAYAVWDQIFAGTGYGVLIQDLQGMHMAMALTGPVPDSVTLALFTGGYLQMKPAGVRMDKFYTPAKSNVPYFGFDVDNDNLSGWGLGYWGVAAGGD